MPSHGYTKMFERMLRHHRIEVLLNADYRDVVQEVKFDRMVYSGPVDAFFDHAHGALPYRSLRFVFQHHAFQRFQEVAQVNYPNAHAFTRITEFKHMTGQPSEDTTVAVEYPQAHVGGENEPYYPLLTAESRDQYNAYAQALKRLNGSVILAGRLAEYKYYNMDQVVERALDIFKDVVAGGAEP